MTHSGTESRGLVDVKGKGPIPTWFVVGRDVILASGDKTTTPMVTNPQAGATLHTPPGH